MNSKSNTNDGMQGLVTRANVTAWQVLQAFGVVVALRFVFGHHKTFLDCLK